MAAMQRHSFVYLASQSPRRSQLLQQIGAGHQLLVPDENEDAEALEAVRRNESAPDYVQRVTEAKLDAARERVVRRGLAKAPILCADTTVVVDKLILGKPASATEAGVMLQWLSGRTHQVLTAVMVHDGKRPHRALSISQVRFAVLPDEVVQNYVASGDAMGKAGAYAIQSALAGWIEHIEGSYSGVMGLPLFETTQLLRAAGVKLAL
jgi:septum formation protein